ncbi:YbaB/EbfC family DNA-binding protein [Streptomyces sp. NHF165]|nr:YbaB/EbfC family DNA-binding protein [Streptomyces sp. NHF165]
MEADLARLQEAREQARAARESLDGISATATARDRLLSVTVDARGIVQDVRFHTTRYRSMAAAELSAAVLETIGRAQEEAAEEMRSALAPVMPDGIDLDAAVEGHSRHDEMLDAFVRGCLPGQQDATAD